MRDNQELCNASHLFKGAVAYYPSTGQDRLLRAMMRSVDHVALTLDPLLGQKRKYCWHQEVELAAERGDAALKRA